MDKSKTGEREGAKSRRVEEKRKEGPSQAKETEQRAVENETRGKKIESSDS